MTETSLRKSSSSTPGHGHVPLRPLTAVMKATNTSSAHTAHARTAHARNGWERTLDGGEARVEGLLHGAETLAGGAGRGVGHGLGELEQVLGEHVQRRHVDLVGLAHVRKVVVENPHEPLRSVETNEWNVSYAQL